MVSQLHPRICFDICSIEKYKIEDLAATQKKIHSVFTLLLANFIHYSCLLMMASFSHILKHGASHDIFYLNLNTT